MHLYVIHLIALVFAEFSGYGWRIMILNDWVGQVQNANGTLKAEMNLKASANQISGQIFIISNGTKDVYNLKGNVSTNTATGTLVYKDGTVSKFSKIGSQ